MYVEELDTDINEEVTVAIQNMKTKKARGQDRLTVEVHKSPTTECIKFDVNIRRPRRSRRNEKDKLLSRVEPRSNDQQTSTPDTEPRSPEKRLSPHSLL